MDRLGTTGHETPGSNREERRSYYTFGDALEQFRTAILEAGITPPDNIIGDGQLHRFKIDGKLNGAYVLHLDGIAAGYFEDFKQGIKHTWKQTWKFMPLSELQRQALTKKIKADAAARQAEETAKHDAAAKKARYIWDNAKTAPANHPYLVKKRIGTHGARIGRGNTLILPLLNKTGEVVNLQFITETGEKRFLSGGLKKGCFYSMGPDTSKILICEGFATGASLSEDSGYMVVIAFDSGNLKEVAINIRSIYPDTVIVICGDNDLSGVGQKAAKSAALAIAGECIIPATLGDFNDMLSGGAL